MQESSSSQFTRLEELKRRLEALNPSRSLNSVSYVRSLFIFEDYIYKIIDGLDGIAITAVDLRGCYVVRESAIIPRYSCCSYVYGVYDCIVFKIVLHHACLSDSNEGSVIFQYGLETVKSLYLIIFQEMVFASFVHTDCISCMCYTVQKYIQRYRIGI